MKKEGGTKVGNFLRNVKGIAPSILQLAGTITGVDGLNDLADKIKGSDTIKQEDKDVALELLKMDLVEMQEVTKRWESDKCLAY